MKTKQRLLTAEEFYELPGSDDVLHELIRGVMCVQEPRPKLWHGWIQAKIGHLLFNFVEPRKLGIVATDPGFVLERRPDTVRAPDVCFVVAKRIPSDNTPPFLDGAPDLAVEVLSPSNTKKAMAEKVAQYLATGARLVWVVNPKTQTIRVHRPDHAEEMLKVGDQLSGYDVLPGFQCAVAEVFDRYWQTAS